ncbi:hypothetical protein QAD02_013641 [Eretmocerus hayati]|uniref:Uncharacterized protein n=1 Tax=Eretmocerus hayati TaxID=131215 RepID=A0ACC2P5N8_9HYME|nr:hypothetical protein QAD02_013641 [Eretmocerus hayati]
MTVNIVEVNLFIKEAVRIKRELQAERSLRNAPGAPSKSSRKNVFEYYICESKDHMDKECPQKPTPKVCAYCQKARHSIEKLLQEGPGGNRKCSAKVAVVRREKAQGSELPSYS